LSTLQRTGIRPFGFTVKYVCYCGFSGSYMNFIRSGNKALD